MAEEKTYTARRLTADDIFLCVRVINKIGIKDMKRCFGAPEVKTAIASAANGRETDLSGVGMTVMLEMAGVLLEHLPDCKNEIYALLASLYGITQDEVAKLPSGTFTKMIMEVIRKEEFRDFFTDVFGSFKPGT